METIPEVCEESSSQVGDEDHLSASSSYGYRRSSSSRRGRYSFSVLCSRCDAMGSTQLFKVSAGQRQLELHKCSLVSRSSYLARILRNSSHFKLPLDFPGGMPAFEAVVDLCSGRNTNLVLDSSNIATLRCAAEYLEMNSGAGNLCEKTEFFLSQALASWDGTVQVLSSCWAHPEVLALAEELFIVHRCVETLGSMVCNELEQSWMKRTGCRKGSNTKVVAAKTWIRDLLRIPPRIFSRIIISCGKQGLSQKNVSLLVVKYAEKWLFSESYCSDYEEDEEQQQHKGEDVLVETLECIVRLLPIDRGVVPISFLFALLRYSIAIGASSECRIQIETRIAAQLDLATIDDLLMPFKSARQTPTLVCELDSMKHIVGLFMAQCRAVDSNTGLANWEPVANVARVWDEYLAEIGYSGSISPSKFAELIDAVPGFVRVSHDQLYKAVHIFLKAHPAASQHERSAVCKSLDCQKLSHEACIHVVQNELMPLRTIVQAMFVQQLHTRSAVNRVASLPKQNAAGRFCGGDSFRSGIESLMNGSGSCEDDLPFLAKRDKEHEFKADLEATNSKLESLEQQLLFIRKTLQETSLVNVADQVMLDGSRSYSDTSSSSSSSSSIGRKISKAFQKIGLCKSSAQGVSIPADKCFTRNRSIHPEDADHDMRSQEQHLLGESSSAMPPAPARISTSSREDAPPSTKNSISASRLTHPRRYSIS